MLPHPSSMQVLPDPLAPGDWWHPGLPGPPFGVCWLILLLLQWCRGGHGMVCLSTSLSCLGVQLFCVAMAWWWCVSEHVVSVRVFLSRVSACMLASCWCAVLWCARCASWRFSVGIRGHCEVVLCVVRLRFLRSLARIHQRHCRRSFCLPLSFPDIAFLAMEGHAERAFSDLSKWGS